MDAAMNGHGMNGHAIVPGGVLPRRLGESDLSLGRRADDVRRDVREEERRAEDDEARASGSHIRRFLRCFGEGS